MQQNREKGKFGEMITPMILASQGYTDIRRTGRGHDFSARKTNVLGQPVGGRKYIETKTGRYAKPSKLQKKTKKKMGSNYKILRLGSF